MPKEIDPVARCHEAEGFGVGAEEGRIMDYFLEDWLVSWVRVVRILYLTECMYECGLDYTYRRYISKVPRPHYSTFIAIVEA